MPTNSLTSQESVAQPQPHPQGLLRPTKRFNTLYLSGKTHSRKIRFLHRKKIGLASKPEVIFRPFRKVYVNFEPLFGVFAFHGEI
jgi:hypothetical protein